MDSEDVAFLTKAAGKNSVEAMEAKAVRRHAKADENREEKRALLPIRTKQGWVQRSAPVEDTNGVEEHQETDEEPEESEEENEWANREISVVELIAKRREFIAQQKVEMGSMASNFLEAPQERINVLEKLVKLVSGTGDEVARHTVTKLAALTVCEILKDVIPSYKILELDDKNQKLKKETLKLNKYEQGVLNCTKNYLVKLEKLAKGQSSSRGTALSCMCQILVSHPHFNFASNVVAFVTPFLCSGALELRSMVKDSLSQLFREDRRGEISAAVVRKINHYCKTKKTVRKEMLEVLLSLRLHALNEGHQEEVKKSKEMLKMSKKEKKRQKARAKLDKELLEAKGEESKKVRLKFAAEITNLLFGIYFRILKSSLVERKHLIRPLMSGLAKFGHLMSIDYFQDLLRNVDVLLVAVDENKLGQTEALLCIHTVFVILSGQGDQLTIDPATFYRRISHLALEASADSDHAALLQVLQAAFILRRKKVTKSQLVDIWKRVTIRALNSSPEGACHLLQFLNESANANPTLWANLVDIDQENETGLAAAGADAAGRNLAIGSIGNSHPETLQLNQQILNGQSLVWEIKMLSRHTDDKVASAAQELLKGTIHSNPPQNSK